jgi:hypothetical protein
LTVTLPLPFENSRELARGNPLLDDPCVALEVVGLELDARLYQGWRRRVEHVARTLDWPVPGFPKLADPPATLLCFTAPPDQLRTAREANEWALCASVIERDPCHWGALRESFEIDELPALDRLRLLGAAEARALLPA